MKKLTLSFLISLLTVTSAFAGRPSQYKNIEECLDNFITDNLVNFLNKGPDEKYIQEHVEDNTPYFLGIHNLLKEYKIDDNDTEANKTQNKKIQIAALANIDEDAPSFPEDYDESYFKPTRTSFNGAVTISFLTHIAANCPAFLGDLVKKIKNNDINPKICLPYKFQDGLITIINPSADKSTKRRLCIKLETLLKLANDTKLYYLLLPEDTVTIDDWVEYEKLEPTLKGLKNDDCAKGPWVIKNVPYAGQRATPAYVESGQPTANIEYHLDSVIYKNQHMSFPGLILPFYGDEEIVNTQEGYKIIRMPDGRLVDYGLLSIPEEVQKYQTYLKNHNCKKNWELVVVGTSDPWMLVYNTEQKLTERIDQHNKTVENIDNGLKIGMKVTGTGTLGTGVGAATTYGLSAGAKKIGMDSVSKTFGAVATKMKTLGAWAAGAFAAITTIRAFYYFFTEPVVTINKPWPIKYYPRLYVYYKAPINKDPHTIGRVIPKDLNNKVLQLESKNTIITPNEEKPFYDAFRGKWN